MKVMQTKILLVLAVVLTVPQVATATLEQPYEVAWVRQLGTSAYDASRGVSADGFGNVYISGITSGSLGGPNAGREDAFVSKYDSAGNLLWNRQLGTSDWDRSYGVSTDKLGNVYITGSTEGTLGGRPNVGSYDAFVSKYDPAGNLLWIRQLGTSESDASYGVLADGLGNVYISGYTLGSLGGPNAGEADAFVSKFNSAGSLLWTHQLGTSNIDRSYGVSADMLGNVYISGIIDGLPRAVAGDAFLSKYDLAGNLLWSRQLGTSETDASFGVSADGLGNVYISGWTWGSLGGPNAGERDAFVSKYNSEGNLLWARQLGTSDRDGSSTVSADDLGNVYISGFTRGSLGGPNAGAEDAFVSKYDPAGNLLWTRQLGTIAYDGSSGVSVDGLGNVYISGGTSGSWGGPNAGYIDAFVVKLVPEPGTILLLGLGGVALLRKRRFR